MVRETGVQSQIKSYQRIKKWYLMPPGLTFNIIKYGLRGKWSNPGKGVVPSPTLRWSSHWKGSLRVDLDYGHQLYYRPIGIMFRVFANGIQSQFESYQRLKKWYLIPPCLTLSITRYGSKVKWGNIGNKQCPPPTSWCSSCRKKSLRVTLDNGHQLYYLLIAFWFKFVWCY